MIFQGRYFRDSLLITRRTVGQPPTIRALFRLARAERHVGPTRDHSRRSGELSLLRYRRTVGWRVVPLAGGAGVTRFARKLDRQALQATDEVRLHALKRSGNFNLVVAIQKLFQGQSDLRFC